MSPDDPRHGTYAGHKAHRRANEKSCDPCREAANENKRQKRAEGSWCNNTCPACGKTTKLDLCRSCSRSVPTVDLSDEEIHPPTWVRRGLIWVAA